MLPKPSYMTYESEEKSHTSGGENLGHTIVHCPSCKTKFAVDSSIISSIQDPRFHCSRCDSVFSKQNVEEIEEAHHEIINEPILEDKNIRSTPPLQSKGTFSASRSSIPTPIKQSDFSFTEFPPTPSPADDQDILSQDKYPREPLPHVETFTFAKPASLLDSPISKVREPARIEERTEIVQRGLSGLSFFTGSLSKIQNLAISITPILAAFTVLVAISYGIRVSPQTFGSIVSKILPSFITPSSPVLPPSDLVVTNLSFRYVTLQSKEVVPVVSGVLLNRSDRMLDDVSLEALGFNQKGEILVNSTAPLRSALSREKIANLSMDEIARFQRALGAKKASIAPNESLTFSIALLDSQDNERNTTRLDPADLKYFSARIFSVGG